MQRELANTFKFSFVLLSMVSCVMPLLRSEAKSESEQKAPALKGAVAKGIAPPIRFRAKLTASIDGAIAKPGDPVYAELLDTIMMPNGTYAGVGSLVTGEILDIEKSRKLLKADFSPKHWRNANGMLAMKITKICGKEMLVDVIPAPRTRIERKDKKSVPLSIDKRGEVSINYNAPAYTAANVAISGASFAAGPVGWIVSPVVGGIAGGVDPTFAYGRPVTEADGHAHVKGCIKGVVGGLPGGFIITGLTNKGLDVSLIPGDVITFQERGQEKVD
ncbi:MAG: hypothetical protein IAF58_23020 [Leptolyngbya sp.]|nr:hypothetical protein [Candidatus Melainabacteria bacterium]